MLAAELETLQTRLDTATRLRSELANSQGTLKELEAGIASAVEKIQDAKGRLPELREQLQKRDSLANEVQKGQFQHDQALKTADDALDMIIKNFNEELAEDDEELREIETSQNAQVPPRLKPPAAEGVRG